MDTRDDLIRMIREEAARHWEVLIDTVRVRVDDLGGAWYAEVRTEDESHFAHKATLRTRPETDVLCELLAAVRAVVMVEEPPKAKNLEWAARREIREQDLRNRLLELARLEYPEDPSQVRITFVLEPLAKTPARWKAYLRSPNGPGEVWSRTKKGALRKLLRAVRAG